MRRSILIPVYLGTLLLTRGSFKTQNYVNSLV
ncbi:hypothetical protein Enr10x_48760 [Gimesia panareensis]|uniref:Uncharacterized protein n=1 Tax=Gimesia panareensis TaxID=2527978 RepID=A0A517QD23_9PLAN|nr:hypothetical protein Enr10x_48760 [Gimesia panareensis]